jgi:hypothetical protein
VSGPIERGIKPGEVDRPDHVAAAGQVPRPALVLAAPVGGLLCAALICLPLKGLEVALGYGRLLGAQGPMPEAGNPLS